MLKIKNLKKYFNKGRPNEIHAVDDITITLEGSGLVVLLGKSGCGKTTLLNAIGGLDRPDNGEIIYENEEMARYNAAKWDKLRNKRIGYIFQNYNLINNITVYKNLEVVLKLAGLTEKEKYAERIEYALSLVGMEKYKNRRPDSLSGGQMQRVGIARALVKGADVIIADEPTGNLDDKNTMAVMEILKGISKHCLVVLVTHEEKLAYFYGDRIIKLIDGKIVSDEINENTESLEHRHADVVYLGDMEKNEYSFGNINVNYFFDEEEKPLELDIISHEGKFLLRARNSEIKVNLVTKDSTIKLLEGKYKKKEKAELNIEVDTDILAKVDKPSQSIFKTAGVVKNAFNNFLAQNGAKRKNPFRTMFISAFLIVAMIAFIAPNFVFDAKNDLRTDSNMLNVTHATIENILPYEEDSSIIAVINRELQSSIFYIMVENVGFDNVIPLYDISGSLFNYNTSSFSAIPYSAISDTSIEEGEVYLDNLIFERLSTLDEYKGMGLKSKDDLIGQSFRNYYWEEEAYYMETEGQDTLNFTIKGFVDRGEPLIYLSDEDYNDLNRTDNEAVPSVFVLASDTKAATKLLENNGYEVTNCKEVQIKEFYKDAFLNSLFSFAIVAVMLIIQIIAISKTGRAAFIGKVKEITILRAIGTPRKDIMKGIFTENAVIISLSTLRGWLISSVLLFILYSISAVRKISMLYYNWWLCLSIGALLFGVSILIALWSPLVLLRKPPAELMTKYDM